MGANDRSSPSPYVHSENGDSDGDSTSGKKSKSTSDLSSSPTLTGQKGATAVSNEACHPPNLLPVFSAKSRNSLPVPQLPLRQLLDLPFRPQNWGFSPPREQRTMHDRLLHLLLPDTQWFLVRARPGNLVRRNYLAPAVSPWPWMWTIRMLEVSPTCIHQSYDTKDRRRIRPR